MTGSWKPTGHANIHRVVGMAFAFESSGSSALDSPRISAVCYEGAKADKEDKRVVNVEIGRKFKMCTSLFFDTCPQVH